MKKLILSMLMLSALYEIAMASIERVCIAPAGCRIVMETGECPNCIDMKISDVIVEDFAEIKVVPKKIKKRKIVVGPCDDWIDKDGNLIAKN